MKQFAFLLLTFWVILPCKGQIDSLKILNEVRKLGDYASKQAYLDKIYDSDRKFRGSDKSAMTDLHNLVSISYFFNYFGYPTEEEYGEAVTVIPYIWIHNSYRAMRREAFPLVHTAWQNGLLSDDRMRTYFLKISYQKRFDDEGNLTRPMEEIFQLLNYNTSDHISIKELITGIEELRTFQSQPKKEVLRYQAADKAITMVVNGERVVRQKNEPPVEIFTFENGKIFFHTNLGIDSPEPEELLLIGEKKYKFKYRQTDKYFEINTSGNLIYRDKEKIIETYLKGEE